MASRKWVASDGTPYDNKQDADRHEQRAAMTLTLAEHVGAEANVPAILDWIEARFVERKAPRQRKKRVPPPPPPPPPPFSATATTAMVKPLAKVKK